MLSERLTLSPYPLRSQHNGNEARAADTRYGASKETRECCQRAIKVHDMIRLMKVHLIILTTVKVLPANRG